MIAIGIGANSSAQGSDFPAAIAEATREIGHVDVIATFDAARFADQVKAAACQASAAYCPMPLEAMRKRNDDCVTRSERTIALFGIASVAEAAALAGAGSGSRLIMARRIIGNITVAAAQSADGRERSE